MFEWDPHKNDLNIRKHGISFAEASVILRGPHVVSPSTRPGEPRFTATGMYDGKLWTVIYTKRSENIRIISARGQGIMKKERIVRYTAEEIDEMIARGETGTDWEKINNMTEEEIERNALEENRALGIPDDWYKNAVPVPGIKDQISIRLDRDVLEWFRSHFDRYQTHINAVLRAYMNAHATHDEQGRR